jgi:integrase
MALIEERKTKNGKTHYRVLIRLKGHAAQTATFERKTDAKDWAQRTESAIREGRHFNNREAKRHTFAELADRYIKDVLPKKKDSYSQDIQMRWWKERLGQYSLADITPALIVECRDILLSGKTSRGQRTPATVNRYLAVLSHAFSVAMKEWEWLEDSPMKKITKQKEPKGRVRFLSDEEREKLLHVCKESQNPYLFTVVTLALSTGARKDEIMSLTWKDVDIAKEVIQLTETKNGERRALPLKGLALELVRKLVRRLDTNLLFPSKENLKKPMDIRKPWESALKKSEIEDFKFHDLRHSAASYLAMNGATLAEIAEVLGHKTLQMVKRYAHLSHQHTAGVVERMNEKIFGVANGKKTELA